LYLSAKEMEETLMPILEQETEVLRLLKNDRSALLISLSGGKDSAAMLTEVWAWAHTHNIPQDKIYTITAHLGRNEWNFALPHIQEFAQLITGKIPIIVERPQGDVLQQWEDRYKKLQAQGRTTTAPFSDAKNRFCTSAAKRGQINKAIIKLFPRDFSIIQCVGLRASESSHRKKANPLKYHTSSPTAPSLNRHVYTWLPIHQFSLEEVWHSLGWTLDELRLLQADVKRRVRPGDYEGLAKVCAEWGYKWGQAYAIGNTRLSCRVCPLANKNDLLNGIAWNVGHFLDISSLERRSGFSFQANQWLSDLGQRHLTSTEIEELEDAKQRNTIFRQLQKTQKKTSKPEQLPLF
jgi:3'-phosphoadenosine 5'-phosphosulfate sulfotransferase (PAPS reductase)/FAD synthetase